MDSGKTRRTEGEKRESRGKSVATSRKAGQAGWKLWNSLAQLDWIFPRQLRKSGSGSKVV